MSGAFACGFRIGALEKMRFSARSLEDGLAQPKWYVSKGLRSRVHYLQAERHLQRQGFLCKPRSCPVTEVPRRSLRTLQGATMFWTPGLGLGA